MTCTMLRPVGGAIEVSVDAPSSTEVSRKQHTVGRRCPNETPTFNVGLNGRDCITVSIRVL